MFDLRFLRIITKLGMLIEYPNLNKIGYGDNP